MSSPREDSYNSCQPQSAQKESEEVGNILVAENDPVFGAVLEDRLHVAGHEVELVGESERAVPRAAESPRDLLILEIGPPDDAGLEVVEALRQRPETRTLPILVLSKSAEAADRVAALRAGADDYLTKPCDLEELLLRAERLVGARAAPRQVLQGDLANHPLWELVQLLQQAGHSGSLSLRGATDTGRLRFAGGEVVGATWGDLPPREALLAVLGLKQGTFRFAAEPDAGGDGEPLPAHEALMEAAWLEDELQKRRDHLPVSGAPLTAAGGEPPEAEGLDAEALPVGEVLGAVREGEGIRLFDLIRQLPWAPQKIRLVVAWLVEQGLLSLPAAAHAYPTTSEITSTQVTEMAVTELLAAAREVGFGTSALPFLIVAEPGNWPALLELLENVPGFQRNDSMRNLKESLSTGRSGSVAIPVELGKLALHVRTLETAAADEIDSTLTVSAGVLLWLDEGAEPALAERVVERLESTRHRARGVVVAGRPEALELARRLTEGRKRWRMSAHAPQSLLGVFRLLQPSVASGR